MRHLEVDDTRATFDLEVAAGGVGDDQGRLELGVDSAGRAVDHDALPLAGLKQVMVGGPRRDDGVADRVQGQHLGGRHTGVARGLPDLGQEPDREDPPRREPQPGHHLGLVQPGRAVGGDADGVLVGDRLTLGVELFLRREVGGVEHKFLGGIEMLAGKRDVDLGSLGPTHGKGGEEPRGGESDRLGQ